MEQELEERALTTGQKVVLGAAAAPMLVVGGIGATGTFTNMKAHFTESATALGVVAAGEGATLILALVLVGLTLLGQSSPAAVRFGLWALPAVASATGAVVAGDRTETVVYTVTPMAMCVAAEGLGLLARRVVIYRTRIDMEARRRNAATMQKLAVARALAANHPSTRAQKRAELRSWRLARKIGAGDEDLGIGLVTVQRDRMTQGADTALAAMFAPAVTPSGAPALAGSVTPALGPGALVAPFGTPSVTGEPGRHATGTSWSEPVTGAVTQVSPEAGNDPSRSEGTVTDLVRDGVTATVTDSVTVAVTDRAGEAGADEAVTGEQYTVTLEEIAAVAGVPVPVPGERMTDSQLAVVLRHLRYRQDPPVSYRQAVADFRSAGYVGSEERVRRIWGELMSSEERDTPTAPDSDQQPSDHQSTDEDDEDEAAPRP